VLGKPEEGWVGLGRAGEGEVGGSLKGEKFNA